MEQGTDELYYGSFQVGTSPAQTFTADFDTGSADLFVPGPSCGTAQGCKAGTQYSQKGTDRHTTTSVTYGSGMITGEDYFDTVTVAGLTASNTNLVSLTSAQGFSSSDSNSLMGMGFSTIANSKEPTYFENLMSQGKVKTPEFSFFLGRSASGTTGQSELTLGGRDTSKYTGAVTSIPVTQKGYWQVAIDGASVNSNTPISGTSGQAAIDTGTTIILAPTDAASALFAQIPGSMPLLLESGGGETLYGYPCDFSGKVNLVFGGKSFVINPQDFNLGVVSTGLAGIFGDNPFTEALNRLFGFGGQMCAAAIAGADLIPGEELYIVGDSFLKNWYSIYSYTGPSVSFAAAKGNQ